MRVAYRDWVFEVDAEATRAAYARVRAGGANGCLCDPCRNFVRNRETVYPEEVLDLFRACGIDALKEGEAYWIHRTPEGLHAYGGWFHFFGSVVETPRGESFTVHVGPTFSIYFLGDGEAPRLDALAGPRAVQVEFHVEIPWNCDREEPLE
jgi:hypothetical protein